MPTIRFVAFDGTPHEVTVPAGTTLMQAATANGVPGVDGDCGGQCACATCHVFVEGDWATRLPAPSTMETEMLGFAAESNEHSRLACQIPLTDALDGLTVRMPEGQH